jgi:hypothetical protein
VNSSGTNDLLIDFHSCGNRYSKNKRIYKTGGDVSPLYADAAYRLQEARFAKGWYDSIIMDTFTACCVAVVM